MDKYYAVLYKDIYLSKLRGNIKPNYGECIEISKEMFDTMIIPCDLKLNPTNALELPVEGGNFELTSEPQPNPKPTTEEKIAALTEQLAATQEVLDAILMGEVKL